MLMDGNVWPRANRLLLDVRVQRMVWAMKQVVYGRDALKALSRMPSNEAKRIRTKITQYAQAPGSLAQNVVKLQGRDGYRLRVGDWRVIFAEDGTVIDVVDIGPRSSIYD